MKLTVNVANLPIAGLETWWQALWLPQGIVSPWMKQGNSSSTLDGIAPKGFTLVEVWSRFNDPDSPAGFFWEKTASKRGGEMVLQGDSVVRIDFAGIPWLPVLAIGGGLAAVLFALSRRR